MSQEKSKEEVRGEFIDNIKLLIDIWDNTTNETPRSKLEGLAHSILTMLDGGSGNICGFIVAPLPHQDDKQYCIDNNKDYYPQNHESNVSCDIGGGLHELLFR